MKTSSTLAALAPALAKVNAELRTIVKDSTNPHFKNSYASLDTILETVRPILTKHGLSLLQGASTPHTDESGRIAAFSVETMLLHTSGEFISNSAVMPLAKADPQGAGGAMTYGRRYGVSALLALATDEDDDGNSAVSPKQQAQQFVQQTKARAQEVVAAGPLAETVAKVTQAAVQQTVGEDPACPTCGGKMWDNREGKKNPKAPDFKCRDKQCDGVIWPPKTGRPPAPAKVMVPADDFDIEAYAPDDADLPF